MARQLIDFIYSNYIVNQLASWYGVDKDKIADVEFCDNPEHWEVVCPACHQRKLWALDFEGGELPNLYQPQPIRLTPEANLRDTYGFVTVVLTGQCEDCGTICFARYKGSYGKKET